MQKKEEKFIWNNTKAKIIVATAFVAGAAKPFLATLRTIINFLKDVISRKKVEVVSVSFSGNDSLDIKLRNTGETVSILKTIVISLSKIVGCFLPDARRIKKVFLLLIRDMILKSTRQSRPGTVIEKSNFRATRTQ